VTASDDEASDADNEDSGDDDEDHDDCVGRRNSAGGRKTCLTYFPRESVEESDDDSSCMDAETMLFAIVL
jgi:hypothetical protein